MMKRIIQTTLVLAGVGIAGLLMSTQSSLAQGTSCTVPGGHSYGTISGSAGSLICTASSSIGASLSNKITLSALAASGFHIGHVNSVGNSYIRALSSISVSGGGSCSASGGQYHNCTGLVGGSSVISFTDSSLSEFGTISFKWGTGSVDSGLIGQITTAKGGTGSPVQSFLKSRASRFVGTQPSMAGFIDGSNFSGGGSLGSLDFNGTANNMSLNFSSSLSRVRASERGELAGLIAAQKLAKGEGSSLSDNASAYSNQASLAGQSAAVSEIQKLDNQGDTEVSTPVFTKDRFDVWTEIFAARSKSGDAETDMLMAFLGAHYFVSPDFLVGAMVQYDHASETNGSDSIDGNGWMAGPYIAGRFPGQNLLYEARFAWGTSANEKKSAGSSDDFDTQRWLVSGQLKGNYTLKIIDEMSRVMLNPFVRATYFEERQLAYTDSTGARQAAQTSSMGEIQFGPKLVYETQLENGLRIRPSVSSSGLWTFAATDSSTSGGIKEGSFRARMDTGLGIITQDNWIFDFSSYYDGLGIDDYEAYGGKARLTIPLN
jgi:hypothetical protein